MDFSYDNVLYQPVLPQVFAANNIVKIQLDWVHFRETINFPVDPYYQVLVYLITYVYMCACTYVRTYVHMYVCMYICMQVCMHACTIYKMSHYHWKYWNAYINDVFIRYVVSMASLNCLVVYHKRLLITLV